LAAIGSKAMADILQVKAVIVSGAIQGAIITLTLAAIITSKQPSICFKVRPAPCTMQQHGWTAICTFLNALTINTLFPVGSIARSIRMASFKASILLLMTILIFWTAHLWTNLSSVAVFRIHTGFNTFSFNAIFSSKTI